MAPTPYMVSSSDCGEEPISRTYQYRKVMKPMLERKRRARINRCLDELKELMVTALQSEGENVSKLEKADILELTVRHLHNLKRQHQLILPQAQEQSYADRFRAGFTQCAQEVSHFITTPPSEMVDPLTGRKLLQHLSSCVRQLDGVAQNIQHIQQQDQRRMQQHARHTLTPPTSPRREGHIVKEEKECETGPMWRPW
ncbi:enhancer of split mbeta protein-like [Euwallacea fornicatus]|uniref:enhancer of split mbeta protein-like n=1 Tax=Euwallacea fornicatus TaxID=995702 RepID=UPI00338FD217